ncbi:MAG: hypothetical protein NZ926_02570 [Candidatus Methanomethylicia archaeon]|nr:hypothetical protein [Candidatus Methanomethylicia archaeon]MCX8169202.1 hypothetical protein [Candidatus Methanomethylicia archaeon]MDW7989016.1 hypothetical protein [Nitrososphaerota archaeon]
MFDNSFKLEFINLHDLLHESRNLIISSFGPLNYRFKINISIIDYSDWNYCLIIDPHGLYKYLRNKFMDFKLLKLGFNASINPFSFKSEDPYSEIKFIVDIFRLSFHIGEDSARILQNSLINLVSRDIFNPNVKDVISEIEIQSSLFRYSLGINKLLRFLDLMTVGRVGSSFNFHHGFTNLKPGLNVVDISHLPVEFRIFSSLLTLFHFSNIFDFIVIEDVDLISPALIRALREEYAVSFERSMLFYDILKGKGHGYILLSCYAPSFINPKVRSIVSITLSPILVNGEYFNDIVDLFSIDDNNLKVFRHIDNKKYFLVFINGDLKISNYSCDLEFKGEFEIEDELKISKPMKISVLHKLFGDKADLAHSILSFLSQGTVEKDLMIGYATSVLGLDGTEARKMLTILTVNGLIFESIHRDGKCHLKISPIGASILEEYNRTGD